MGGGGSALLAIVRTAGQAHAHAHAHAQALVDEKDPPKPPAWAMGRTR